jgi:hypothetical protein
MNISCNYILSADSEFYFRRARCCSVGEHHGNVKEKWFYRQIQANSMISRIHQIISTSLTPQHDGHLLGEKSRVNQNNLHIQSCPILGGGC